MGGEGRDDGYTYCNRTTMEISACALLCYPNIFNVLLYVHVTCIRNTF